MTKRVAWFTGQASGSAVTPYKVYDVFNEDENSFNLKDDNGGTRLCLKKGCAHICHKDWVLADVVEEVEEATTEIVEQTDTKPKKAKKWSAWLPHTNDEQPVADDVIVKVKWGRGCLDRGEAQAYWWQDKGITHYKLKLKDLEKSKPKKNTDWQDNVLGKRPVPKNTLVEVKLECGETFKGGAAFLNWGDTPMASRNIVKWRLAD